ncbi:MAG: autotransporter-associated beta strand repeat-containing protein [Chthoniobacterales bacterium]|nr:autotransporter-associated beta strand repeat-containing protein [Chthoniobacterales bacterium]
MKTLFFSPLFRKALILGATCAVWAGGLSAVHATTYTWLNGTFEYGTAANWSPSGPPGSSDSVNFNSGNGTMRINANTTVENFTSDPTALRRFQRTDTGGTLTMTISGTLSKGGTQGLEFRQTGAAHLLNLSVGKVVVSSGSLTFGSTSGASQQLNALTIGSMEVSGGVTHFLVGGTASGTGTISGDLGFTSSGTVQVRQRSASAVDQTGVLEVGSLSSVGSNGVVEVNANTSGNVVSGTLRLNNASGSSTYGGVLRNGGTGNTLNVEKNNAGTQILSGANTYTGVTTVTAGTLLISGDSSAANGAVAVNGGKLYVSGTLGGNVTLASGATIGNVDAGSLGTGTVGNIVFNGGSFLDLESLTSTMAAGTISFANTGFGVDNLRLNGAVIDWSSVGDGTYTLLTGTLDETNLDNFGLANAQDIGGGRSAYFQEGSLQLVVIPEPRALLLAGAGMMVVLFLRRRRSV